MFARLLGIGLLATLMLSAALPEVWSQTLRDVWSTPEMIGDGWWQSLTVDRAGTLHVVWYGGREGLDALYYRQRTTDNLWSDANDVFQMNTSGSTVRNSVVASSDGMLNLVFRVGNLHRFSATYTSQATAAGNWRAPVDISINAYYADLAVDRNDVLHVVYGDAQFQEGVNSEFDPCYGCADLLYRRSTNGGQTWSTPANLTQTPDAAMERPDIFEGASGRLYVVWDEGFDPAIFIGEPKDVRMMHSEDGGLTWSGPVILGASEANPGDAATQIAMGELRTGELLAVWRHRGERPIYYQVSQDVGVTWTESQPIPGILAEDTPSRFDDYELVVDQLGTAHLFAVGSSASDPDGSGSALYHLEYRQGVWWRVERIFYDPELQVTWPKAAIGRENDIHLTWFVSTSGVGYGESSILQVYYSHRAGTLLDQPALAFNPTRIPQPTPTLVRQLMPTVTPLPTVEPLEHPVVAYTRDTYASQAFVGGMLAVAALCGGILAFTRFWRR